MMNLKILTIFTFLSVMVSAFELTNEIPLNRSLKFLGSNKFIPSLEDMPDDQLTTLEMIERAGYPAEAHAVTTSDGYILTMHRIPGKPGSTPVLVQHGLLSSSADWVVIGKGKALAFILADKGYDVWLGNARGNTYSRAHTTLSTSDSEFWDFSFHEMGLYDLPAVITYITDYKNDTILYIGHSMGTTMFYVMASRRPEIADKVRAMMALAPVAYVSNMKSPVRLIAPFSHDVEMIAYFLGADEFLPHNEFIMSMARYGCDIDVFDAKICANTFFVIFGFDKAQFNYTLMPEILSHVPAGASTKTIVHYAQEINTARFQAYDYGSEKNREYYNNSTPPDYDLSKVHVPVALFTGDNDWLVAAKDADHLWQQLPNRIEWYRVKFHKFNHEDFLYAIDAPKLVYEEILSVMEKYRGDKSQATPSTVQ